MNDHAMKAAPRKTGAIILGGGACILALLVGFCCRTFGH